MAFRRGDNSEEAMVGAILFAEGLDSLRVVRDFALGMSKKGGRRG